MIGHGFGPPIPRDEIKRPDLSRFEQAAALPQFAHLRPLIEAQRCGVELLPVERAQRVPADFPHRAKSIAIIRDDGEDSWGPCVFDQPSIRSLAAAASHLMTYSGPPAVRVYATAALAACLGGHVLLVECQPHRHEEWIAFVDRHARRGVPLIEVVPSPGGVVMQPRPRRARGDDRRACRFRAGEPGSAGGIASAARALVVGWQVERR